MLSGLAGTLPAAAAKTQPTIALVTINLQAIFFTSMNRGAQAMAKKLGAHLVIYNANNSAQAQNSAIEDYVQQHVAAIIVDAIDVHGVLPAIRDAQRHHIPVVAVDAETLGPGVDSWVGVGNWQGGVAMGKFTAAYIKAHMGGKAAIGIVGALNSFIQIQRQDGFQGIIRHTAGTKVVQVVDGKNVQDVAETAAEDLITANPQMNVIYATGEPALIATVAAVRAHGDTGRIKVFGWDLSPQSVKAIHQGWVIGVLEQNPYGEGLESTKVAWMLIHHEKVPKKILLKTSIVTKANVQKFVGHLY